MPLRFSIEHANWLAHALQGNGVAPRLRDKAEWATLTNFARSRMDDDYYYNFHPSLGSLVRLIDSLTLSEAGMYLALGRLNYYYTQIPWTALLIPSGTHAESDRLLMDPDFLRNTLSYISVHGPILQLQQAPAHELMLEYVFPAFRVALAHITRWPGLLIWDRSGHASFFELSMSLSAIRDRLTWIFSRLARMGSRPDLLALHQQFLNEVLATHGASSPVRILHLSDLHLGSSVARQHLPRVQKLVELAVIELGGQGPIVPIITGDLIDSPDESALGDLRAFIMFLDRIGVEDTVTILGNHDVRKDGWRSKNLKQAINISRAPAVWLDDYEVGILCFNSVNSGYLARGFIGKNELANVGNHLDRYPEKAGFTLAAALHHHPIPVEVPPWYQRPWYERLLGQNFERTEALEDSGSFLEWLNIRSITAVLHGHRHIPRFSKHNNLAVVGCGSTVGKVRTTGSGETYMSFNILTIDRARGLIGCRLLAERIPGAGVTVDTRETHEIVGRASC